MNRSTSFLRVLLLTLMSVFIACNNGIKMTPTDPQMPPREEMSMGNGVENNITTDGFHQNGSTFTFPEVKIVGNGWLVMHPFKDGKPVPTVYVGATYLKHGMNKNVRIMVNNNPGPKEKYILMLHWDVDQDKDFDFGDGITVRDAPVLEGKKMIAFPFQAK